MKFARGEFGRELLSEYVTCLGRFPDIGAHNVSREYFNMALQSIAECWKRFVLPTRTFPWAIFRLLDCTGNEGVDGLVQSFARLKSQHAGCDKCVDVEFSVPVLKFFDIDESTPCHKSEAMKNFLEDMALYSPLSSDLVECRHGICQHLLHRWRGVKPTDPYAAQSVTWQLITRGYRIFREFLWSIYGDRTCKSRLARFGYRSACQFTKERPQEKKSCKLPSKSGKGTLSFEKMDHLLSLENWKSGMPMPRKLSGHLGLQVWLQRCCCGVVCKLIIANRHSTYYFYIII